MTPLMSDTFFGHFCWALVFRKGESYLVDFLESYGKGRPAPVLFSSGFPSGYLPAPALPAPGREKLISLVKERFGSKKVDQFRGMSAIKETKKISHIPVKKWLQLKDNFSQEKLIKDIVTEKAYEMDKISKSEVSASNVINRESGTVSEEGGLFQREKTWYLSNVKLDLYVEVNNPEMGEPVDWFLSDYLPENGFGADKSTGMGVLSISRDEAFDEGLFQTDAPNARLSLSMASFEGMEKYDSHYRLRTKFGKLGGTFAVSSPTGGNHRPFKKPVLMYDPGAVFFTPETLSNKSLLKNVHSDTRIRHCGIPITLPFTFREDDSHANIPN